MALNVIKPSERKNEFTKLKTGDAKTALSTGFSNLDKNLRIDKSYLMVVTGVPSSGKSEFVDALLTNMAILYGWKSALYSPENRSIEDHMRKLGERFVGKTITDFNQYDIDKSMEFMEKYFTWILPENPDIKTILAEADKLIDEEGISCLVLDPWNSIMHNRKGDMLHEYLAESLSKIIRFGKKKNILTIIVAHPTKPQKDKEGHYLPINLYDISDGAMWRNRCDYGIVISRRDMKKHGMTVSIQKCKQKWLGEIGDVDLDYEFKSGRLKAPSDKGFYLPHETEPPF